MIVKMEMFCDICKKRIAPATGAIVLKHTVGTNAHPTRHLCERCYGEVFEKSIKAAEGGAK